MRLDVVAVVETLGAHDVGLVGVDAAVVLRRLGDVPAGGARGVAGDGAQSQHLRAEPRLSRVCDVRAHVCVYVCV